MAETTLPPPQPHIKVHRISAVSPAVPTERQRMFLSNLDLLWLPINNLRRLLFYRNSPANQYSSVVENLKRSLSSALVYFYPLAARLVKGESSRPEVDCNDEGVEFIEASVDIPFNHLEKDGFQHKPFFEKLVRIAHLPQYDNYTTRLLSIQVTAFEGGGICIGTTLHHVIADGNSFWHFMKSWAECSRGLPVSKPPNHNRTFFNRENKKPLSISFRTQEVVCDRIKGAQTFRFVPDDSQTEKDEDENWMQLDHKPEDLIYSKFHFTKKIMEDLKQTSGASSSFVAVASQFWRSMVKARQMAEEETVYFAVMADCRGRLKPPLPPTYFGNCISVGFAQTTAKKLMNKDISFAAGVVQETINSCTTEEQVNNMIEWLESPENGFEGLLSEVGGGQYCTNVVGSPRFPVYEIDHGWGKPVNVQVAAMIIDGASEGGGNMVVSTRLPRHQMETLTRLLFLSVD